MCLNVFVWFLFSLKVEKLNLQALGTSRTNPMSPKYKGIGDIICKCLRNLFRNGMYCGCTGSFYTILEDNLISLV